MGLTVPIFSEFSLQSHMHMPRRPEFYVNVIYMLLYAQMVLSMPNPSKNTGKEREIQLKHGSSCMCLSKKYATWPDLCGVLSTLTSIEPRRGEVGV